MGRCRTRTIVHRSGTGWIENDECCRRARGRCRPVRRPVLWLGRERYATVKNKICRLRDRFLLFQLHRDVHAETIVRVRHSFSFNISHPQQTSPASASLSSCLLALWLLASVRGSGSVARAPAFMRRRTPQAGRGHTFNHLTNHRPVTPPPPPPPPPPPSPPRPPCPPCSRTEQLDVLLQPTWFPPCQRFPCPPIPCAGTPSP